MDKTDLAQALIEVGRLDAVPILLNVLGEFTGLRFAAVCCITGITWHACAVKDGLRLGVKAGSTLDFMQAFSFSSSATRKPILIEKASGVTRYFLEPPYKAHRIESFFSVPIKLATGGYFGTLCATDSRPAKLSQREVVSLFKQFAALIAGQLEQQASRNQERAALLNERATNELREQFIAILGHDLRNPLHAVYASSDLLEQKLTDPAHRTVASRIKTQAGRMAALIEDVLDFARGRLGGGIGLEITDVQNVSDGLFSVIQELQDARAGAQILSSIDVNRPVRCDLARLQQVVSNLLGNALMHGQPNSPVKISASTDEKDFILRVWNTGKPIPPGSLPKIFEPFWRHSVSGSPQGLGLGLYICSQIILAHQGRISVTSTPEHGTEFTAHLPLHKASFDAPALDSSKSHISPICSGKCGNG